MTFKESYEKYLVVTESNGTTDKLSTDKGRYALQYNIAQNKVIEWLIESNGNDENRYIQSIKVPYSPLTISTLKEDYQQFELPENYFEHINLKVKSSSESCSDQRIKAQEVKWENVHNLYDDPNSEPSFKYRETFYTISQDALQVFKKDFEITEAEMTYYRYPKQITLQNPDNPESQFTQDTLEFDDKLINRIIFMTASLHSLSSDDPKYQALKQETIQKF